MSVEFLSQIAAAPLPKSFNAASDIDAVKVLRQAGLVLALLDEPPENGAKVLAVTERGREELMRFHYPTDHLPLSTGKGSWVQLAAQRAREAIQRNGASGRRSP